MFLDDGEQFQRHAAGALGIRLRCEAEIRKAA
jgi:hypothetical protein